jgi:hypothetical protein
MVILLYILKHRFFYSMHLPQCAPPNTPPRSTPQRRSRKYTMPAAVGAGHDTTNPRLANTTDISAVRGAVLRTINALYTAGLYVRR